ncbi:MAG: site-2 protease family protein [bacterium]
MDSNPVQILMGLMILAFSVIVHEVAHGYVAYRLGDPTAHLSNRLSLNPLNHIDPVGSIILPLLLVLSQSPVFLAWAKPVPVDPRYFRNPRRDDLLVSIAGVVSNMILAVMAAALFRLLEPGQNDALSSFLWLFCAINVGLAVFNMVPVPPLDGSHVLAAILPASAARAYSQFSGFGFIIIIALMGLGVMSHVVGPIISWTVWCLMLAGTGG